MDLPACSVYKEAASGSEHPFPGSARTHRGPDRLSMRRAQLPSLLASLLLLASQASLGAGPAADLEGSAGSEPTLRLRFPAKNRSASRQPPRPDGATSLRLGSPLRRLSPEGEALPRRLAGRGERLQRREPPLSIDLTFHLLRHLMEISRAQSQQAQAELNRQLLDSVGK